MTKKQKQQAGEKKGAYGKGVHDKNPNWKKKPKKKKMKEPLLCLPLKADEQIQVLRWHCEVDPIPIAIEKILVEELLPKKEHEKGMMRKKSKEEIERIKGVGEEYGITMASLCSLRRHHIKNHHIRKTMPQLGLGNFPDINASARIFECVIEDFLRQQNVAFYTEEEQKRHNILTPDFLLKRPILLRSFRLEERNHEDEHPREKILVERQIHWIEVKMFYGASTIGRDGKSAVGSILNKVEKYTALHGDGAIIFFQGYGDILGKQLLDKGVVPLECCTTANIQHKRIEEHQKTWCANKNGEILP